MHEKKAQGSLEYLLIIGSGILISTILIIGLFSAATVLNSSQALAIATTQCAAYPLQALCADKTITISGNNYSCTWSAGENRCTATLPAGTVTCAGSGGTCQVGPNCTAGFSQHSQGNFDCTSPEPVCCVQSAQQCTDSGQCNNPPECKTSPGICSSGECRYQSNAANGTACTVGSIGGTCLAGTCDTSQRQACTDVSDCTPQLCKTAYCTSIIGSVQDYACAWTDTTACTGGDNCCPSGCNGSDTDCPSTCIEGEKRICQNTGTAGTCTGSQTCTNNAWGTCGGCFTLSSWAPYIDAGSIQDVWDSKYLPAFRQLQGIGFTHTGIHIWTDVFNLQIPSEQVRYARLQEQLQGMRDGGMQIMLNESTGHWFLPPGADKEITDTAKYFDTPGFDPYTCAAKFNNIPDYPDVPVSCCDGKTFVGGDGCPASEPKGGCLCRLIPSSRAIDPAYTGTAWQRELTRLDNLMNIAEINATDTVSLDTELWGWKPTLTEDAYLGSLGNNTTHYSGTLPDRFLQFYNFVGERGTDIMGVIKVHNPSTQAFFYNENPERIAKGIRTDQYGNTTQSWYISNSSMPTGTGDAPAPDLYHSTNLQTFQSIMNLDQTGFTGTIPWISFSTSTVNWYATQLYWDPKITQKVGFILRERGVKGAFIYPGPWDHEVPIDYYMLHAQALVDGLVKGIDPELSGPLVESPEAGNCSDGWDNDGDGKGDATGPPGYPDLVDPDCVP